ncbi:MAG: protein kinase [Pseudomonadota bacterium]|nr:protein kinase [Pseudomonadota bacterium]
MPPAPGGPVVAGRYRVERLIARGGMAAVFLAEHIALRRRVALKILHPPPDADESGNFEKRFRLEAETLATLDHPNIVTLYDYGEAEDGRFYLAMEYIEGPRFTDLLGHGALPPDRAIRLILEVCAALRYAHKRGVIHRDLKPSNLLIGADSEGGERLKVVDFGLVKVAEVDQSLTREGLVLGSPHCMAPEQVRGGDIDQRADIYAIGILLFRSLTGVYPFHGATSTATMVAHLNEPIPTFASVAPELRVPGRLEDVVRRCLSKRPADRYPDASALMEDLNLCLGLPPQEDTTSRSRSASLLAQGESGEATRPDRAAPSLLPTLVPLPEPPDAAPASSARRWPLLAVAALVLLSLSGLVYFATLPGPENLAVPATPAGASLEGVPVGAAAALPTPVEGGAVEGGAVEGVTPPGNDAAPTGAQPEPPVPAHPEGVPKRVRTPAGKTTGSPSTKPGTAVPSPENPEGYMPLPDDFK